MDLMKLFPPPTIEWAVLMPFLTVVATGLIVMLWDLFVPLKTATVRVLLSLIGLGIAIFFVTKLWNAQPTNTFYNSILSDRLSVATNIVLLAATALVILFADGYLRERKSNYPEFYPLILWATAGAMLMISTTDLIIIFLGLETLSIALYVLAGLCREDRRSEEAAIKYFLLGAFASGFLLYGIALIYGATGSSSIADIPVAWQVAGQNAQTMLIAGTCLLLVGLGFKAALVPFHMWTPDVYQGAPTAVTAYMAAISKTAAFVTLIRFLAAAAPMHEVWQPILTVLAVLTMTVGNLLALTQTDVKRMLGYSSIAHAGYLLVGVLAGDVNAVIYYLIAYSLMTVGAFAIVGLSAKGGQEGSSYADMRGLWKRAPFAATMMLVFMISLAGIPPTAGFFGKYFLILAAWQHNLIPLAIVLAVNSVISVYYYLRLTVAMYVDEELVEREKPTLSPGLIIATLACAVGILYVGLNAGNIQQLFAIPVGG